MDISLVQIIILAVVQGVTEFVPVSSSGHLVILARLMELDADIVDVSIVLHAGTLLSILFFYWRRVLRLVGEDRRVIWLLVVGTIPAVFIGLTVKLYFENILSQPLLAGAMLFATGGILLWANRLKRDDGMAYREMTYSQSLWIGLCQAFAILPGVSRSGTTICAGLGAGLRRESAATFSFLLAIPAIGGATVLEIKDLASEATASTPIIYLITGAMVAFFVGLISLWWLIKWLERGRLSWFAYWCFFVGSIVLFWQLWPGG